METALRYKLLTLSTLFTLFTPSSPCSLLPPQPLFKLFTYCIHIFEWFERHGKALWLDEQNKISFASNLRIEEIVPLNIYNKENSIPTKVGKLGAKKRAVEQSIGAELLTINIIFLKLSHFHRYRY